METTCKYWLKGKCIKGSLCKWNHNIEENDNWVVIKKKKEDKFGPYDFIRSLCWG